MKIFLFTLVFFSSNAYANSEARDLINDSIDMVDDLIDTNPGNRTLKNIRSNLVDANRALRGGGRGSKVVEATVKVPNIVPIECRDLRSESKGTYNVKRMNQAMKSIETSVTNKCRLRGYHNCYPDSVSYSFKSNVFDCNITGTINGIRYSIGGSH